MASIMAEPELDTPPPTMGSAEGAGEFELLPEKPPQGLLRRVFSTQRHLLGLLFGGLVAWVRERPPLRRRGLVFQLGRVLSWLVRPFLNRRIVRQPFPVQLRRRLEILGPTYIKLGQILSLRRDLLPDSITRELGNLLDRLPVMPFDRYLERVERDLGRPVEEVFRWVDPRPLGSASIAQTHRGTLVTGEDVILKVVKPGIRETLHRDARLLWLLGRLLQIVLARFQPKQILDEFVDYTLREVDLRLEADNAETFRANFKDMPEVVFPQIYRHASGENLLTMEFLDGFKPSDPRARRLSDLDRDRLVDLGASSIIRMIYRDGFFHADLHPGNLLILPGPKVGFIDLGMVGRFSEELRRTLLYYYFSLITGDAESAARYLALVARPASGADPAGFRRTVTEICRRWARSANFQDFSLGQLILLSVARGGEFRMYFPVEMVLMVKAIITFEGVGQMLKPGLDVATASRTHINRILLYQFSPLHLAKEGLRGAPELLSAFLRAPMLITEGIRYFEEQTQRTPENPFAGIRGTVFGGFCLLAGALIAGFSLIARSFADSLEGPWYLTSGPLWVAGGLVLVGVILAMRRGG
jgi:ubiquinone biosynthesis protein